MDVDRDALRKRIKTAHKAASWRDFPSAVPKTLPTGKLGDIA
jgi:hypothetical protein